MKRTPLHIIALGGLLLAGCYSMEISDNGLLRDSGLDEADGKPVEHVLVSNYGWYLFNCVPLVCGNAAPDETFPWSFFTDEVNPVLLHDRMMTYAKSENCDVRDLVMSRDEKVFFEIPGSDIPCPIPFLLCYHEVQISGVLVDKAGRATVPAPPEEEKK